MVTVADTARWAAAQRARETQRPDRLFDDPLAAALAGELGIAMIETYERSNPLAQATADYVGLRTRFLDELAIQAVHDGIRQVVIAGAGMDARAFRLDWLPGTELYELDQKVVFDAKQEILQREGAQPRCRRIPLAVDLEEDWAPLLLGAGFRPTDPSLWILEGLLFYLEEHEVHRLLARISWCACAGSIMGAELVSRSFFTSSFSRKAVEDMASNGMIWRFGTDDPEEFFAEHGWSLEVFQPGDEGANFGRWRYSSAPRELRDLPHTFLVKGLRL